MTETQPYQAARKHVRELKDFWIHLAAFLVANTGMTTLNLIQQPDKLWFHWVLMGWGAGLLLHAFKVFGGGIAKNWEEKKIQEIVKRDEMKETSRSNSSTT
jgi:hypothetical protein